MAKILEKIKKLRDDFFEKKGTFSLRKMEAKRLIETIDFSDDATCKNFLEALITNAAENHTKPFDVIFENVAQSFSNRKLGDANTLNQIQSVSDGFKAIKKDQQEHGDVKYKKDYAEEVEKPIENLIKSCVDAVENLRDGDPKSLLFAQTGLTNLRALKKASETSLLNIPGFDFRRFEKPPPSMGANIEKLDAIAMAQRSQNAASSLVHELLKDHPAAAEKSPAPRIP